MSTKTLSFVLTRIKHPLGPKHEFTFYTISSIPTRCNVIQNSLLLSMLYIVYIILGISPASNCSWPTFRNPVSVPSSKAGCRLSTSSLWRWKWHRVPKRRPTTIWRRGNTQKNIYNIRITAKVWNLVYFIYCSDVYIDATWAQLLHLLCLVNPFNPFSTFEVLIIFRFTSVLLVSLRVVPFQHFKVSSCIGPACLLNLFPSSPFHEVYIVS